MEIPKITTKKGNIVFGLVLIVTLAAFAIYLLIMGYIGGTVATELKSAIGGDASVDKALDTTITTSTITLNSFWYILFGGMVLGLFVSAFFMRDYPLVMVPIFLIILAITVVVAIAMSNAYEKLAETAFLSEQVAQQAGVGYIMLKLPYVAVVLGLIAIGIMFARPGGGGGGAIIN